MLVESQIWRPSDRSLSQPACQLLRFRSWPWPLLWHSRAKIVHNFFQFYYAVLGAGRLRHWNGLEKWRRVGKVLPHFAAHQGMKYLSAHFGWDIMIVVLLSKVSRSNYVV